MSFSGRSEGFLNSIVLPDSFTKDTLEYAMSEIAVADYKKTGEIKPELDINSKDNKAFRNSLVDDPGGSLNKTANRIKESDQSYVDAAEESNNSMYMKIFAATHSALKSLMISGATGGVSVSSGASAVPGSVAAYNNPNEYGSGASDTFQSIYEYLDTFFGGTLKTDRDINNSFGKAISATPDSLTSLNVRTDTNGIKVFDFIEPKGNDKYTYNTVEATQDNMKNFQVTNYKYLSKDVEKSSKLTESASLYAKRSSSGYYTNLVENEGIENMDDYLNNEDQKSIGGTYG